MANAVKCDGCGLVVSDDDENVEEAMLEWQQIGFHDSDPYDTCSVECSHTVLDNQIIDAINRMRAAGAQTEQDLAEQDREPAQP